MSMKEVTIGQFYVLISVANHERRQGISKHSVARYCFLSLQAVSPIITSRAGVLTQLQ